MPLQRPFPYIHFYEPLELHVIIQTPTESNIKQGQKSPYTYTYATTRVWFLGSSAMFNVLL